MTQTIKQYRWTDSVHLSWRNLTDQSFRRDLSTGELSLNPLPPWPSSVYTLADSPFVTSVSLVNLFRDFIVVQTTKPYKFLTFSATDFVLLIPSLTRLSSVPRLIPYQGFGIISWTSKKVHVFLCLPIKIRSLSAFNKCKIILLSQEYVSYLPILLPPPCTYLVNSG